MVLVVLQQHWFGVRNSTWSVKVQLKKSFSLETLGRPWDDPGEHSHYVDLVWVVAPRIQLWTRDWLCYTLYKCIIIISQVPEYVIQRTMMSDAWINCEYCYRNCMRYKLLQWHVGLSCCHLCVAAASQLAVIQQECVTPRMDKICQPDAE